MYIFDYSGQAKCIQRVVPGNVVFGTSPYCYEYKEFTFTFTGGGTAAPVVGRWIKGATTACQAKIVESTPGSGSIGTITGAWGDGDAAGTLRVASVHGSATSEETYFNGSENVSVVDTADDLTMTSKLVPADGDYPFKGQLAKAMLVNVLAQTALCCWDGSIPDQSQLIGISIAAGASVLLTDINSIINFKFIDRVSASASTVELIYYF